MENRAYAIAAGLFTILLAVAVFITAKWLTGGAVARDVYELVSPFPVTGLNPRGTVRYRGVEVGRVETMRLNPENQREILVRVLVDRDVKLTKSSYAQLGFQGVTGIAHVQLEDDGTSQEVLATSALDPARIPVRQSFLDQLTRSSETLLASFNETANRVNAVLSPENQERLARLLENLNASTQRLDGLMADFQVMARALPGVVAEASQTLKRAESVMARLGADDGALERFARAADQIGATSRELGDAVSANAVPRIVQLTEEMTRSTRNLDRLVRSLEEQPQSLVFGRPAPPPGPGEPGFTPPAGGR
jgi:phospholipid/cholesterol/gamma-HCH transport system substrate-binding protein